MAAVGAFTIKELGRQDGRAGESFEWVAARQAPDPALGGARAIPVQPWIRGGQQRSVRTDYPGAKTPSEQVLGPRHKDHAFTGRWDDRYNFDGYAKQEEARFEAMARRGNLVEIAFQEATYVCLIKDWDVQYHRNWFARYAFQVSVHDRTQEFNLADRSPTTTKSASEAADEMTSVVSSLQEVLGGIPEQGMSGDTADIVKASIATMAINQDSLLDTLDQRELAVSDNDRSVSPFSRLGTQFRAVRDDALQVQDDLLTARSDLNLGVNTAKNVLDFEDWSRSMRFNARVLLGQSDAAAVDMDERDKPDALRLYRPFAGESLYNISRTFYGTPFSWRLIADRNALDDFELTGDELLVIPERGRG